jgi:arginine/serine-rich splicing factor 1/9
MDITEREVDDLFYKFGRIHSIEIKTPSRPPAFAFLSFDDRRDAEDALYYRDGYRFDGERLRVEFTRDNRRDRDRGEDRRGVSMRSPFRVTISGLPDTASWQDLKDFMRCGGDIVYADVDRRGGGVVEFSNNEDMLYAVKKKDQAEFDMRSGRSTITCKAADDFKSTNNSRSRSRSSSRSRSRSRSDSQDQGRKPSQRESSRSPDSRSRSPGDMYLNRNKPSWSRFSSRSRS